jgi:hypothetical protein
VADRGHTAAAERRLAGRRERDHAAPGEHIGRRADVPVLELLRGHVRGRADDAVGERHHAVPRAGDTEVDHAGAVGAQQHVGRLEVAVHDAGLVDRGERRRGGHGEAVEGGPARGPPVRTDSRRVGPSTNSVTMNGGEADRFASSTCATQNGATRRAASTSLDFDREVHLPPYGRGALADQKTERFWPGPAENHLPVVRGPSVSWADERRRDP